MDGISCVVGQQALLNYFVGLLSDMEDVSQNEVLALSNVLRDTTFSTGQSPSSARIFCNDNRNSLPRKSYHKIESKNSEIWDIISRGRI